MDARPSRVALVTGSSKGIGRRIATVLAADGMQVVVTARGGPGPAGGRQIDAVVDEIRAAGGDAMAVAADLTRESDVERLVEAAHERYGRVDVLVNNAASRLSTRILDTSPADFQALFRINVVGPFLMWHHVIPMMIERGGGHVINLISTNAPRQPFIGMAPYRMTKAALTYLSADLAHELEDQGIAVNALDPGPTVSDGTAAIRSEREQRYDVRIPYHAQDEVDVIDAPIRWLAWQTVGTFTGQCVRRVDFGVTWGDGAPAGTP
jgi:3-oxoacyl-[acyl-carrier protein] reductase